MANKAFPTHTRGKGWQSTALYYVSGNGESGIVANYAGNVKLRATDRKMPGQMSPVYT